MIYHELTKNVSDASGLKPEAQKLLRNYPRLRKTSWGVAGGLWISPFLEPVPSSVA